MGAIHLMSGISDLAELLWKRLDAVGWCEEGCFDLVLFVQLEKAVDSYSSSIDAS